MDCATFRKMWKSETVHPSDLPVSVQLEGFAHCQYCVHCEEWFASESACGAPLTKEEEVLAKEMAENMLAELEREREK